MLVHACAYCVAQSMSGLPLRVRGNHYVRPLGGLPRYAVPTNTGPLPTAHWRITRCPRTALAPSQLRAPLSIKLSSSIAPRTSPVATPFSIVALIFPFQRSHSWPLLPASIFLSDFPIRARLPRAASSLASRRGCYRVIYPTETLPVVACSACQPVCAPAQALPCSACCINHAFSLLRISRPIFLSGSAPATST